MTTAQSETPPGSGAARLLRRVGPVVVMHVGLQAVLVTVLVWAISPPVALGAIAGAVGMAPMLIAWAALRPRSPGPVTAADHITLVRVLLTGAIGAATVLVLGDQIPARDWMLTVAIALTLATDAVDGPVARRTGTAGPIGARFDMEADAALLLVLSVLASVTVGPWVLAIGAMRYLFVAASWARPRLGRALAYSSFRRAVAGVQGAALVTAVIPIVPVAVSVAVLSVALALLVISFGRDVVHLERLGRQPTR